MGLLSRAGDLVYTLRFLRLLTTPFDKTTAFELGLIDEKGKKLKKPETKDEKGAYNTFHRLVFNIKRILEKVPFGSSRIKSYAAALFLLKEEHGMAEEDILKVLEDLGHSTAIDLDEDVKHIEEGQHILNHDIADYSKGSIINLDSIKPVSYFAGVPIYKTRENILISAENIL